ncbi:MAG: hypothetical protein QM820_27730 [Minicystis sp.]
MRVLSGCGAAPPDEPEEDVLGAVQSALVTENAIVPNAIVPNAIVPNAIVPSALVSDALAVEALDAASLAALADPGPRGDLSRMFLRYVVGCALGPTQSVSFSWTDPLGVAHDETYWGAIGIAPSWATQPLWREVQQRLVSACLAARTNYYGTSVSISLRSPKTPLRDSVTSAERSAYTHVEGAFWGNIFAEHPHLYACYNASNASIAHADARVCATGVLGPAGGLIPCGPITLTGPCAEECPTYGNWSGYYAACNDTPSLAWSGTTSAVITTFLP